jgi:heme exporter protein B
MRFWRKVTTIVWKDILSEMRAREGIASVLVFTLLVIVIFNFAFGANPQLVKSVAPGMLWVTFAFAGVLSLNRAFIMEREEGCMEGLMVCPISRDTIYVGKMLGSLIFMLILEIIAIPIFTALFNLPLLTLEIAATTFLTTVGFVTTGTLFSAMAVNTKARELVLPILFLPIVSPIIICAVNASGLALSGESWSGLSTWLEIIVAFDVVVTVAAFLIFTYVIEE